MVLATPREGAIYLQGFYKSCEAKRYDKGYPLDTASQRGYPLIHAAAGMPTGIIAPRGFLNGVELPMRFMSSLFAGNRPI